MPPDRVWGGQNAVVHAVQDVPGKRMARREGVDSRRMDLRGKW